ncbi:MAG: glycosyltransferase family A protein [Algibacter sp.]
MLAIVIPYYNFKYFEETLDSLANQTDKRFKVYIGNDASLTNPLDLLNKYRGEFDFEYKIFEDNLGGVSLVKQWERCINLIGNEAWIQILGDDDVLDVNCVSCFYKNLEDINSNVCKVVRFGSRYIDSKGKALASYKDYFHPKKQKSTDSYFLHFLGKSRSSLSEHIFSKESYQNYKFHDFPLAWHSDDKAWLDFTSCGNLYTINEAIVEVRLSKDNISGKRDNLSLKKEARYLFFNDLVFCKILHFKKYQKIELLLEYGILMKELRRINFNNVLHVVFQLIKIGAMYSLFKFVRRMYIATINK